MILCPSSFLPLRQNRHNEDRGWSVTYQVVMLGPGQCTAKRQLNILSRDFHASQWQSLVSNLQKFHSNKLSTGAIKVGNWYPHAYTYGRGRSFGYSRCHLWFLSNLALLGRLFNSGTADSKGLSWFSWQNALLLLWE